jgi:hypothetical protein
VRKNRAVPTGLPRLLAFLHPAIALASLGLMAWVASLGLRCRERGGEPLRRVHERVAPWAYGLMLFNFLFGCWSTVTFRRDLELAAGMHFRLGIAIAALFTVVAVLSRRIAGSDAVRLLHPALGLVALLLSALQVFFGMSMLPL